MKKVISTLLALGTVMASMSCAAISAEAKTIKGDLNGDNFITLRDATLVQRVAVGAITPTEDQTYSSDYNNDGVTSTLDSFEIQKYLCYDSATLDKYAANVVQRMEFIELLNAERVANGLKPFEYNDAMLAAGHQRATEVLNGHVSTRPNGDGFWTILEEYNISYNDKVSPYHFYGPGSMYGDEFLETLQKNYSGSNQIYPQLMSDKFSTICVGAVKSGGSTYTWVIIIN